MLTDDNSCDCGPELNAQAARIAELEHQNAELTAALDRVRKVGENFNDPMFDAGYQIVAQRVLAALPPVTKGGAVESDTRGSLTLRCSVWPCAMGLGHSGEHMPARKGGDDGK